MRDDQHLNALETHPCLSFFLLLISSFNPACDGTETDRTNACIECTKFQAFDRAVTKLHQECTTVRDRRTTNGAHLALFSRKLDVLPDPQCRTATSTDDPGLRFPNVR